MVERRRLQRRAAMNYHVLSRLALLCCFSLCRTSAMKNPCHPAAHKATPSYGCRKIVLPKNMCTQCNVGAITDRGHYKDCTRTTTTGPACMSKFEEYLAMNPCDTQRKRAYEIFREGEATGNSKMREEGRSMIDYYLYAVCEQSTYLCLTSWPTILSARFLTLNRFRLRLSAAAIFQDSP